ncbi:hypothetical protein P6U16_26805 (plasmid) [Rhizobium sp. 32-5/1]|uniref:hypothetical protein n=1 Tax=Rhizobium sp. 32-5/1 TaxID=3019602 RepID=UPI00240D0DA8|nr:hypothetical protein [Rhizobium sp. 32-5/1]WEZ85617.1 hypothetical protein P6U16_26805 [Rhizobium sp. 32-5/1]
MGRDEFPEKKDVPQDSGGDSSCGGVFQPGRRSFLISDVSRLPQPKIIELVKVSDEGMEFDFMDAQKRR